MQMPTNKNKEKYWIINKYNFEIYYPVSFFLSISSKVYTQSNLEKILKSSEIIVNGLSILKKDKTEAKETNSKIIESVCVKNKLTERITFRIIGKNEDGDELKKELVILKVGKECLFVLPKGIYTYGIVLANREIYKKANISLMTKW
jgi:hypothetical protein